MRGRPLSIREAFKEASSFLAEQGIQNSRENADLLLQHVLGWDKSRLLLHWEEPFPAGRRQAWQDALMRKAAGEPAQYIIGEQEFFGLRFKVGPAVLIPRPETELLVERIVQLGRERFGASSGGEAPTVADVGAGSGAIAVSLAASCPHWRVMSSDISPAALEVAAENANLNGVQVQFLEGDLLSPYIALGRGIDILVSNPPYIPASDLPTLQTEVRMYEPHTALVGGADGLDLYRRMAAQMRELPRLPEIVGFEVGIHQAEAVSALLRELEAYESIEIIRDLAGIERHVLGCAKI